MKENFGRFISCKSTIDDIHTRLGKAEGDYGSGADGASTADMVTSVNDVSPRPILALWLEVPSCKHLPHDLFEKPTLPAMLILHSIRAVHLQATCSLS